MAKSREYEATDRRPLASRSLAPAKALAAWLARRGVSPNAISLSSVLFALLAAAALVGTSTAADSARTGLWLLAAAGVQLRLLANMLDGMVAVEHDAASAVGELYNEVPDRLSDAAVLVALGFVAGSSPGLGYCAALLAVFVAYVRAVGAVAGASQAFAGIMAKPKRMFLVTVLCLFEALAPPGWRGIVEPLGVGPTGIVLALICLGCVITAITRLAAIANELRASS